MGSNSNKHLQLSREEVLDRIDRLISQLRERPPELEEPYPIARVDAELADWAAKAFEVFRKDFQDGNRTSFSAAFGAKEGRPRDLQRNISIARKILAIADPDKPFAKLGKSWKKIVDELSQSMGYDEMLDESTLRAIWKDYELDAWIEALEEKLEAANRNLTHTDQPPPHEPNDSGEK